MATGLTQCPKCNSTDVFVSDGPGVGWDLSLEVSRDGSMYPTQEWETYLCTNCGYFENYLTKQDWLAEVRAGKFDGDWRRVA